MQLLCAACALRGASEARLQANNITFAEYSQRGLGRHVDIFKCPLSTGKDGQS
eukprot:COSAG01_NODE_13515_length_1574_cov_12.143051_3_plen_52_part_01